MSYKRFCDVCGKEILPLEPVIELSIKEGDGEINPLPIDGIEGCPECIEPVKERLLDVLSKLAL